jgi:galactokinase
MGLRLIRGMEGGARIEYLCDLDPPSLRRCYYAELPTRMKGEAFLSLHGETGDPVTQIDPAESYPVRGAVEHAVYENDRVQRFMQRLDDASHDPHALEAAGRLMYGSHWSYGKRIGLGSPETDLLVRLARDVGAAGGIYGAKITGGGSGGTVALLTSLDARPAVESIAGEYARRTGRAPEILEGTSDGAVRSGIQTVWGE